MDYELINWHFGLEKQITTEEWTRLPKGVQDLYQRMPSPTVQPLDKEQTDSGWQGDNWNPYPKTGGYKQI